MEDRISLTLTPEELREVLMSRIERSLKESGLTLSPAVRTRILDCLPAPGAIITSAQAPQPSPVAAASTRAVERLRDRTTAADKRTRVYSPTPRAHKVADPQSTSDRVLNLILESEVCTLPDLIKNTRRPKKALYTALWQLKKDGLIDTAPLAAILPDVASH